ncbi:hypothetical protein ACW7N6_38300 [Streptomyces sp. UC1A3]
MTGPEHYREAEKMLKGCKNSHGALMIEGGTAEVLAAALVHAQLAQAAATALNDSDPNGEGMPGDDYREWKKAAGTSES